MRILSLLVFLCLFGTMSFGQHTYMQWTSIGADGTLIKKQLDWAAETDFRFGQNGLETFFPQVGIEYKHVKWCKPSIEYRFIVNKNKYGNYKVSNRLNFNLNLGKRVSRFELGFRARYQYSFNQLNPTAEYNPDFDQAIRLKPSVGYDINNSIFTPKASAEFFYDPQYGPKGPGFTKVRLAIGSSLELDGPHDISFKYQLDKYFHNPQKALRHVLVISYTYKF